ncbi:MAG: YdbL family protein [Thermodesulfobacteriota bacterium]
MKSNKIRLLLPLWMLSVVMACVTVNVYFPAKEVEKKAGDIVDDIRKLQPTPPKTPPAPQSSNEYFRATIRLNRLAYAQQDSSPIINNLKQQIRDRFPRLEPLFQKGAVGEGRNGFLEMRDVAGLSAAERNEVKALVDAENRDRRSLYQEVAKSMSITPDQIGRVQRIFAEKWQNSAGPGWWIQRDDGQWVKK